MQNRTTQRGQHRWGTCRSEPTRAPQTADVPLWVTGCLSCAPAESSGRLRCDTSSRLLPRDGFAGQESVWSRARKCAPPGRPHLGCGRGLCVGGRRGWGGGGGLRGERQKQTKKDRESSPTPGSEAAQGGSDAFGVFAGLELWSSWPHCSSLQNSVRPSKSLQLGRAVPTSSYPVPQ